MDTEQTERRESQWMIVAIVMLAFAVFSWGVRYKLSLYNPVAHMSAAKLLSQRERPATFEVTKLAAAPLPDYVAATLFASAMGTLLARFSSLKAAAAVKRLTQGDLLPRQRSQNFFYFFFRPPPVIFSAL